MPHSTTSFSSITEFVDKIASKQLVNTEIPVNMGDGTEDDFFISTLNTFKNDPQNAHVYYLLANAFSKLALRTKRIQLTKNIFESSITTIHNHGGAREYIQGIVGNLILIAISSERLSLIEFIIKKEKSISNVNWLETEHFFIAGTRGEDKGTEITRLLLTKSKDIATLTANMEIAAKNDLYWQAKILFAYGASINNLSESNIRKITGSPKNAIVSLPESNAHALPQLFKRYMTKCKANPVEYLNICPEWQKPYIMDMTSEL